MIAEGVSCLPHSLSGMICASLALTRINRSSSLGLKALESVDVTAIMLANKPQANTRSRLIGANQALKLRKQMKQKLTAVAPAIQGLLRVEPIRRMSSIARARLYTAGVRPQANP